MARRPPRSALSAAVGARVRSLRESQGLTQRTLAEKSGVSARFLAQLEAGDGNISLERFDAVARALPPRRRRCSIRALPSQATTSAPSSAPP